MQTTLQDLADVDVDWLVPSSCRLETLDEQDYP